MYVCMCVCMVVRWSMWAKRVREMVRVWHVCMHVCKYVSMYACTYVYVRIGIGEDGKSFFVYVRIYACMYVCMYMRLTTKIQRMREMVNAWYVCMYVCMYAYVRIGTAEIGKSFF